MKLILSLFLCLVCDAAELTVKGRHFLLDGKPFPLTGVSFFNAIHNDAFNESTEARRQWMRKFQKYGVNMLRVWGQWDNKRGFVDTCPECSLYQSNGDLRAKPLARLKALCADADALGMVIEFAMYSQESWHDGVKLDAASADRATAAVTRELLPYRNVILQIWNEFDERALDHLKTIRAIDAKRVVTNSPGPAGVLVGMKGENEALDFLSPHTSRQGKGRRNWEVAPTEIAYLLARYDKPVLDDEPARNGTAQFGGPGVPTSPYDHILQIQEVWKLGGYVVYHHDMFQMGKGHATVPPSGIPDPEFSPYHRQVFEFLALRERYMQK
jgi:hypothetical protein